MGWQGAPSALPTSSLFQHTPRAWFGGGDRAVEVDWRNTRPPPNGFKRSSTIETVASTSTSLSSLTATRTATEKNSVRLKKKGVPSALPPSSLFQHKPSTWPGGKDKVVEEDWRNNRLPPNGFRQTPAVESGGRFPTKRSSFIDSGRRSPLDKEQRCPISQHPAQGNVRRDRPTVGRSLSRGRSRMESPDAADAKQSVHRSRSLSKKSRCKSRQGRHDNPSSDIGGKDSRVAFEYDSQSAKTARVNKNVRFACTIKTTMSTRVHSSGSQHETNETNGLSRSSKREARARSRISDRDKDKSLSAKSRSLSRGPRSKSSRLIVRQGTKLRAATMPLNDQCNRDGSDAAEMYDYGQLRHNDGKVSEGRWKDGCSEEMDASAACGNVRRRRCTGPVCSQE